MKKGSPWIIIHTLVNIMKGYEHVNIKTKLKKFETKEQFQFSDLYLRGVHEKHEISELELETTLGYKGPS